MQKLLEQAKQLNAEKVIKENFILLKECYGVNNNIIAKETGISSEHLTKIDTVDPVPFVIYNKLADYFGVYVSDLFSEVSLKEKLSLFTNYNQLF